jgi:hypothetical protein
MSDKPNQLQLAIELEPESLREAIRAVSALMQTHVEIAVNKVEIAVNKAVISLLTPIAAKTATRPVHDGEPVNPAPEFTIMEIGNMGQSVPEAIRRLKILQSRIADRGIGIDIDEAVGEVVSILLFLLENAKDRDHESMSKQP